jgi:hypothetical protein
MAVVLAEVAVEACRDLATMLFCCGGQAEEKMREKSRCYAAPADWYTISLTATVRFFIYRYLAGEPAASIGILFNQLQTLQNLE